MGKWKKTSCNMCVSGCGLEVEVENNMLVSARPNPTDPRSKIHCCRKGRSLTRFQQHPDRLDYPLKRIGKEFIRISWDQAYKEIGEKMNGILKEHGPRTIALGGCTTTSSLGDYPMEKSFLNLIGGQYFYNDIGLEFMGQWWSCGKVLGGQFNYVEPHEAENEVLVLWGANTDVTYQHARGRLLVREFSEDPERMLIVVDPRLSEMARLADMHVAPRIGSDALLIRAMIALILYEGWQHQDYLNKHAKDFCKIKPWFDNIDIEESCRVCQIPYEKVRELCKVLTTRKWGMHQGSGITMGRHNALVSYLHLVLMSVCGVLCVRGGCVVNEPMIDNDHPTDDYDPKVWRTLETKYSPVKGVYPEGCLTQEILSNNPKHLRAMIMSMSNPLRSFPDSKLMEKALDHLDLLVVIDTCMTETAKHAHYILPATTPYEGYDFGVFQFNWPVTTCQLNQPVLKPVGERKEGSEIWMGICDAMGIIPRIPDNLYKAAEVAVTTGDRIKYFEKLVVYSIKNKSSTNALPMIVAKTLGKAMGSVTCSILWLATLGSPLAATDQIERAGHKPPKNHKILQLIPKFKTICTMDAVYQQILDHHEGIVFAIAEENFQRIKHADGKLHFFNEDIDAYIKRITPDKENESLMTTADYPLILSAGRHIDAGINGVMRNHGTYKYRNPNILAINPEDGAALGLLNGQKVRLTTEAGSVEIETEFTYQTCKGYVLINHQFSYDFNGEKCGIGINSLLPSKHMDELTGDPIGRYVPCRIMSI